MNRTQIAFASVLVVILSARLAAVDGDKAAYMGGTISALS